MISDSKQRQNVHIFAFSIFPPGGQTIPAWFSASCLHQRSKQLRVWTSVVGGRGCAAGPVQHLSQQDMRLMNLWKVFEDTGGIQEFHTPTGIKANKPAGTNGQWTQNEVLLSCLIPITTFPQLAKYHGDPISLLGFQAAEKMEELEWSRILNSGRPRVINNT